MPHSGDSSSGVRLKDLGIEEAQDPVGADGKEAVFQSGNLVIMLLEHSTMLREQGHDEIMKYTAVIDKGYRRVINKLN